MSFSTEEKKALTIITVVALVFVLAVGGTVAALTVGKPHDDKPYLQLAIGDELVRVEPARWCDLFLRECDPADPAQVRIPKVPVPVGSTVLLSVSEGIADTPWRLVVQYLTPRGPEASEEIHRVGESYTQSLTSHPDAILINIEVQVLSAIAAPDGSNAVARGYLAADTTPPGVKLPEGA